MFLGFAPVKLNLTLRITGRYEDGCHGLDSLVAFAQAGDVLAYEATGRWRLSCHATDMPLRDNLVWRAACTLADALGRDPTGHMQLWKAIPLQSGLGGGSSDAAATLQMLDVLWGGAARDRTERLNQLGALLGADVPACLRAPSALRMGGHGIPTRLVRVPPMPIVLAMPQGGLSTADVFAAYRATYPELARPPARLPALPKGLHQPHTLANWVRQEGNDLLSTACQLHQGIAPLLSALQKTGALAYGMSGSGSACFGLYDTMAQAHQACHNLGTYTPNHLAWHCVTSLLA